MDFVNRVAVCPLCGGEISPWASKQRKGNLFQYDRCQRCDFLFVNPRPTLAALGDYYSMHMDHKPPVESAPLPLTTPDASSDASRAIAQLLKLRPGGGRMLDVGAGSGAFSLAAQAAGLNVTALEVDPAEARAMSAVPGLRVIPTLFESFEMPPSSFDYVLMSHVLEHSHDPRAWIAKAALLLSSGGVLAVMLPNFNSIYRYVGGTRDPFFIPPDHLNHFNAKSLSWLCASLGLREVDRATTTQFPSNVITKRLRLPGPIVPAVRALTTAASTVLDWGTSATGIGSVLIFHAIKE
jgi:2-polyprenyl-3-methyl-5-hydroxy-6-metoxy-1,4-benzoquinol methylase